MSVIWAVVAGAAFFLAFGPVGYAAPQGVLTYSGRAVDLRSGVFLYGERHFLRYQDGQPAERVVLYTCSDGTAFARKIVDYSDPLAPDFELLDQSSGLREGLRRQGGSIEVFYRENSSGADRRKTLSAPPGLVADAGFDEYVRRQWDALSSGNKQQIQFLLPSRLDSMRFDVKALRRQPLDGTPAQVFRLSLSNLLGWVLPSIDVYYAAADHVLLRYEGLSDLRDAGGRNYAARIDFPRAQRAVGDAASVDAAKRAPVAPCRR